MIRRRSRTASRMRVNGRPPADRHRARWPWWAFACAAVLLLGLTVAGCTNRIRPPTGVRDPVPVVLIDYGRTSALVLPADEQSVLYAYGDWDYYAMRRTGVWETLAAVLWPTQGTLGRHIYEGGIDTPETRRQLGAWAEHVYVIRVERSRADALRERLDAMFQANGDTRVYTPSLDMEFVHHPQSYTACNNSNHMVALWLRDLGAEVRGPAIFSNWRVTAQ